MQHIAQRLHQKMTRYNWVGFYLIDPADPNILVVGPYVGSLRPMLAFPSTPDFAERRPAAGKWSSSMMSRPIRAILPGRPW